MSKKIIDCETGEVVERDLTKEEIEQEKKDQKIIEQRERLIAEHENKRLAILERLGLTEDEAKVLLG